MFLTFILTESTSPTAKLDLDGKTAYLPRLKSSAKAKISATSETDGLVSGSVSIASKNNPCAFLNSDIQKM